MVTKSTLAVTTRGSLLGQLGMVLLIGVALGVFGLHALQTFPGRTVAAKSTSRNPSGAIQTSSGQDVLSVEWLEQQRATKAVVFPGAKQQNDVLSVDWLEQQHAINGTGLTHVKMQDDVLSVEWLEQHRPSNPNEAKVGSHTAQPIQDNYIGFVE